MNYERPTPVQQLTIEGFLAGEDMLVQAPTGTGKTAAFGMPMIQRINPALRTTQALILCPTRELALQITTVLIDLSRNLPKIRVVTVYGGESINKQIDALRNGPQILVATPGRLLDHMQRKTVDLQDVQMVVLDEADRMLDMGFRPDMEKILRATPKSRQTVLFSATIPHEIYHIASEYQKQAREVRVEQETLTVETVRHFYTVVHPGGKDEELVRLHNYNDYPLTLVFVNMKHRADRVARHLERNGITAAALHGDMKQSQRDRVMRQYRVGELEALVATDVAARGIDVKGIDAVINYDLPADDDSYIHRIGRTGRAEQEGIAHSLILPDESDRLRKMIEHMKIEMTPTEDSLPLREPATNVSYGRVSGTSFHSINERRYGRGKRSRLR